MFLLGATVFSAVLYGLCFPPPAWRPLAWVAQVPFLLALRRCSSRLALLLAWVFTVTVAYTVGDWFPRAVANYFAQSASVGVAFFFGVSSIMAAPYVMAFAVVYRRLGRSGGAVLPLLAAAAWVSGELGRVKLLTGNPWAVFGYSQAGNILMLQIADLTGVYGVSFLLVAINAALAEVCLSAREGWRGLRPALLGLLMAGATVAGTATYGALRLGATGLTAAPGAQPKIAIVQGNLDLGAQWHSGFYGRNLDAYLRLTQAALRGSAAQLVFWPESAMTFFLDQEPAYRSAIGQVLGVSGAQLVAGGPRQQGEATYYNSTFLLSARGDIIGRYDKEQLLPFAEYFPLRRLDFLRRRFERVREFYAGTPTVPLPTVAGRAGVLICNEAMFAEPAAARVAAGAEYLVNPANDSWLGDRKFSEQVFDIVCLRAVEQRRYVVRTSTCGPSAIIDPFGRVVVTTEPFTAAWISGQIHALQARTVYSRVGDLFAVLCLLLLGMRMLVSPFHPRPTRGENPLRSSNLGSRRWHLRIGTNDRHD
jgi:apolipoprotein N-acyltransferase